MLEFLKLDMRLEQAQPVVAIEEGIEDLQLHIEL